MSNPVLPVDLDVVIEYRFFYSLYWSLGGCLDTDSRIKFDSSVRELAAKFKPQCPLPVDVTGYDVVFSKDYYDFVKNHEASGNYKWILWTDTIAENPVISPKAQFSEIVIPTKDTSRCNFLMDILISHDKAFLLVGPTGTGKSKYVNNKVPLLFLNLFILL